MADQPKSKGKKATKKRATAHKTTATKKAVAEAAELVRGELGGGIQEMLTHAQTTTHQQLREALDKQKKAGRKLTDILHDDMGTRTLTDLSGFLKRKLAGAPKRVSNSLAEQAESKEKEPPVAKKKAPRRKRVSTEGEPDLTTLMLRSGLVTGEQLHEAAEEDKRTGKGLLQTLMDRGFIAPKQLGELLGEIMEVRFVDPMERPIRHDIAGLIPEEEARELQAIPVGRRRRKLVVAMTNPKDTDLVDRIREIVDMEVEPALAFEREIMEAIDRSAKEKASPEPAPTPKEAAAPQVTGARFTSPTPSQEGLETLAESVSVINLVGSMIEGAIKSRATDIHLESQEEGLRVRYRIDGVLYDVMALPQHLQPAVLSRVKVLANMDITEKRHPQDGHFKIDLGERGYDLRIATLPTVRGEKLVIRLLNPEDLFVGLKQLGLEPEPLDALETLIEQPHGMILVTGPIGCGKTTTLYAALSQINTTTDNIVTIEDPVEYQLAGINQVQVDLKIERTFANTLRAVLRQDADTLMVGEIRDNETARIAIRAALTGHMVFSTLHTNNAVGAISTLEHLGIPPFLITNAVIGVVAQRLVRRTCPACRKKYKPSASLLRELAISPQQAGKIKSYKPVGCDECYQTGYKGRTGIFELMEMTDPLKDLILNRTSEQEMRTQANKDGMITLHEACIRKLEEGMTTLEEMARVTGTFD